MPVWRRGVSRSPLAVGTARIPQGRGGRDDASRSPHNTQAAISLRIRTQSDEKRGVNRCANVDDSSTPGVRRRSNASGRSLTRSTSNKERPMEAPDQLGGDMYKRAICIRFGRPRCICILHQASQGLCARTWGTVLCAHGSRQGTHKVDNRTPVPRGRATAGMSWRHAVLCGMEVMGRGGGVLSLSSSPTPEWR
ncbi:hypothetical protein C8Q78DRAFT_6083 [Trametes maxima]|nr:hypothetical protein C8Q78DRAFT_6083 [Trametes maxima]